MMCFRDMSYCSDAEDCKNKETCRRWFSPADEDAAKKWWGGDNYPIAVMSFRAGCKKWEEK